MITWFLPSINVIDKLKIEINFYIKLCHITFPVHKIYFFLIQLFMINQMEAVAFWIKNIIKANYSIIMMFWKKKMLKIATPYWYPRS